MVVIVVLLALTITTLLSGKGRKVIVRKEGAG